MPILGIAIALVVDVGFPAVLAVLLVRSNWRHRSSVRGEKTFWGWFGALLGAFAVCMFVAVPGIWSYDGTGAVMGTIFAVPGSLVPALFNSFVIHFFFTTSEWTSFGYYVVMTGYCLGLIFWASLLPLAVRRLSRRRRPVHPPPLARPAA